MDQNAQPANLNGQSAAQLASTAYSALQSPELQGAQNDVNTASGQYQTQLGDQGTLPQMLASALGNNLDNANDPARQQTQSDLSGLLTAVGDPSSAIQDAQGAVPGAILSPEAQSRAIAQNIGNRGAALTMDNTILGARGMGISGILGAYSTYMASRTQQLAAAVQNAQNARDFLWQKAQGLGQIAMSAAQLKQNQDQFGATFGLQQQQQQFEQAHNPTVLSQQAISGMSTDASKMSVKDFISKYSTDPRLPGITPNALYQLYTKSGGKQKATASDFQQFPDLNTGAPVEKAQANISNLLAYPQVGIQGAMQGAGILGSAAKLARGITSFGAAEGGGEGIGALLGLLSL